MPKNMEDIVAKIIDYAANHSHKPLIFIGFMGSGKTTIGKKIAHRLAYNFIDTDDYIEKVYAKSISTIFQEHGEIGFRQIETAIIQELNYTSNLVISTGGGLPCFNENMTFLNKKGSTIYLKTSVDILVSRLLKDRITRPLLENMSEQALQNFVEKKLAEREIFYAQAQFITEIQ